MATETKHRLVVEGVGPVEVTVALKAKRVNGPPWFSSTSNMAEVRSRFHPRWWLDGSARDVILTVLGLITYKDVFRCSHANKYFLFYAPLMNTTNRRGKSRHNRYT